MTALQLHDCGVLSLFFLISASMCESSRLRRSQSLSRVRQETVNAATSPPIGDSSKQHPAPNNNHVSRAFLALLHCDSSTWRCARRVQLHRSPRRPARCGSRRRLTDAYDTAHILQRIERQIGRAWRNLRVDRFHGCCHAVLRSYNLYSAGASDSRIGCDQAVAPPDEWYRMFLFLCLQSQPTPKVLAAERSFSYVDVLSMVGYAL